MFKAIVYAGVLCLAVSVVSLAEEPGRRTVVYEGRATEVGVLPGLKDLWVTLKDLTRATRFALKPQGVCRDELCFPIPKNRKDQFVSKRGSLTWFNLSEFARLVKQPVAVDEKNAIWCFGTRPEQQSSLLSTFEAPNFTLPDMSGRTHSLSDYRGKKVLLITWASW